MEENEYIPKSSIKPAPKTEEPTSSRSKKQADEPQRPKETKKAPSKEGSTLLNLKDRLNLSKIKIFAGALFSLLSVYLFLACVSYIFTWTKDQDQLLNRSFIAYIFNNDLPPAENWLGKFGAMPITLTRVRPVLARSSLIQPLGVLVLMVPPLMPKAACGWPWS